MNETESIGLFEQTQLAVQPLVDSGNFRLEILEYESRPLDVRVLLCSTEIDIMFAFYTMPGGEEVRCGFRANASGKTFGAPFFFSTFGIDIPMTADDLAKERKAYEKSLQEFENLHLKDITYTEWCISNFSHKKRSPLEDTGYMQELSRLSTEIVKNMPEILELLSPENVEGTYERYRMEVKKDDEIRRENIRLLSLARSKKRTGSTN
ncbi:hypothetical protein Mpet_0966 [Methanolacinia petrolearia DSM 11571]|uniref:Uncharacterized protein n=1 Tax=Methanolacinia petrolearia (strain DSM 11571 / OCM 486 / SEBR 4847) TaxID=679926 RepID=E1RK10_METP4|nr:hypothetical protein [Methanolacinia petrolearia]ADN35733.1 hypothetical protein Mpet_0966 [Methanolacinia petrolearia DSM 11571]